MGIIKYMNTKIKSIKNKTIDFDINTEEGRFYFNKCITDNNKNKEYKKEDILNKTINGNTFNEIKKIENIKFLKNEKNYDNFANIKKKKEVKIR